MHVYVDETKQRGYVVAAAAVAGRDVDATRRELRRLPPKGQRRIHMVKEQDPLRRRVLEALTELGMVVDLYIAGPPYQTNIDRRRACLERLVTDAVAAGCTRLVLESDASQDARDRRVLIDAIRSLPPHRPLGYDHMTAYQEPLLWVPDAVAWAHARGGKWRELTDPLVRRVTTV